MHFKTIKIDNKYKICRPGECGHDTVAAVLTVITYSSSQSTPITVSSF